MPGYDPAVMMLLLVTLLVPTVGILMALTPFLMRRGEVFAVTVPTAAQTDPFVVALKRRYAAIVGAAWLVSPSGSRRKRVRVTFFTPNEVVHFGRDDGDQVYHTSIFAPILFTAKLYIAILTSTLMHRLVRAPAKRIRTVPRVGDGPVQTS